MPASAPSFVRTARAKFNIRLEVGERRADGLHGIRSLVATLSIGDDIVFWPSPQGFEVGCDDPSISQTDNLAWRAAQALGMDLPAVRVQVKKVLPTQAGLGGGSADAAETLLGIARVLAESGITLSLERIAAAAAATGSDVSACLYPGLRLVEGAGEIVRPIPNTGQSARWGVLLLKPATSVPTAHAYRLLDDARARGAAASAADPLEIETLAAAVAAADLPRACALMRNDFQEAVEAAYPDIASARERLLAAGAATAMLCGSGSCVAGIFETAGEARVASTRLQPARGEWAAATSFAA